MDVQLCPVELVLPEVPATLKVNASVNLQEAAQLQEDTVTLFGMDVSMRTVAHAHLDRLATLMDNVKQHQLNALLPQVVPSRTSTVELSPLDVAMKFVALALLLPPAYLERAPTV